jgi:hypothetical protein
MDNIDLSPLLNSQPELYAIFLLLAYLGRKYWPILKKKVEIQQSQFECDARREQHLLDISEKLSTLIAKMDGFATKDDVIDLLLKRQIPKKEKPLNGSGTIVKQGV